MSSIITKGVSWRGFKGSLLFALGFFTHDALTPNVDSITKEVKKILAEAESFRNDCVANLAELEEAKKNVDKLKQIFMARTAELEKIRKAEGLYTVETRFESKEEDIEGSFVRGNGSEEIF